MKITCISDLHGHLPEIKPCDILLIAGDICPNFSRSPDLDAIEHSYWLKECFGPWLDSVPAKEIVAIFGNHDWVGEKKPHLIPDLRWNLLLNEHKTVMGLKIFGSPFSPYFYGWAFNSDPENSEGSLSKIWDKIELDTDIIMVHGPPFGYGDLAPDGIPTGSESLAKKVRSVEPLLCVSGHIHCGRGIRRLIRNEGSDFGYYVNASLVDENVRLVYNPISFIYENRKVIYVGLPSGNYISPL